MPHEASSFEPPYGIFSLARAETSSIGTYVSRQTTSTGRTFYVLLAAVAATLPGKREALFRGNDAWRWL
jgi:hypothetical protein